MFDIHPNLGAHSNEPSLRELLQMYYADIHSEAEAEKLISQYIRAIVGKDGPYEKGE